MKIIPKNPELSIIIPTIGLKKKKLLRLIKQLSNNISKDVQVLVIVQRNHIKLKRNNLQIIEDKNIGRSSALNLGFKKSRGKWVAVIDDDVVINNQWVKVIGQLITNPIGDIVCGQLMPYLKTKKPGLFCPATAIINNDYILDTEFRFDSERLGAGANMLIKKSVFIKNGIFKEWLGVGTDCKAGEDWEFIYRALENGIKVALCKKLVVYHDRWVNKPGFVKQINDYFIGVTAVMIFMALKYRRFSYMTELNYWWSRKESKIEMFKYITNIIQVGRVSYRMAKYEN